MGFVKRLILSLSLIAIPAVAGFAQAQCKAPYAPEKAFFTICPSDALKAVKDPGDEFSTFVRNTDASKNDFVLVFVQATVLMSPEEDAQIMAIGFERKNSTKFTTASGTIGLRLLYEHAENGVREARIFYCFKGPKGQEVLVSFSVDADSTSDIALADSIAKTVVIKSK